MSSPLLSVKNLSVDFTQGDRVTHAVSHASLELNKGETLCVIVERTRLKIHSNGAKQNVLKYNM